MKLKPSAKMWAVVVTGSHHVSPIGFTGDAFGKTEAAGTYFAALYAKRRYASKMVGHWPKGTLRVIPVRIIDETPQRG